tara:strand:- start:971 stop:2113 length:1143 start_codon:yes stop_codon:yes gene_type:complete
MSETIQDKEKAPLKIKKPKKLTNNKTTKDAKVDLSIKQVDNSATKEPVKVNTVYVKNKVENEDLKVENPVVEQTKDKIPSPIVELNKEVKEALVEKKTIKNIEPEVKMPENINKLIDFMRETGGNIQDYARLNINYDEIDNSALLREYYKNTKSHLDQKEIKFIMEDNFKYDEEVDDEREVMKKKLAYKEEIVKAKNFLEDTKRKYYDEIKLRSNVTEDQKEAIEFYNRHNKEQEVADKNRELFRNKTNELFNETFKGFEFNVGEKSFNYNIQDAKLLSEEQANLSTFIKKFLNKDGQVADAKAYHKAIYAATNVDTIAKHFYEQGKTDAVKDVVAKSNNIDIEPKPNVGGDIFIGGLKVKAVNGVDSSKLKFKTKKKNN